MGIPRVNDTYDKGNNYAESTVYLDAMMNNNSWHTEGLHCIY